MDSADAGIEFSPQHSRQKGHWGCCLCWSSSEARSPRSPPGSWCRSPLAICDWSIVRIQACHWLSPYSPVSQPLPGGARGSAGRQGVWVLVWGARVNILLERPRELLPLCGRGLGTWDTGDQWPGAQETNHYSRGDARGQEVMLVSLSNIRWLEAPAPAATTYDFSTKKSFTFSHSHPITACCWHGDQSPDYEAGQYLQSCLCK